MGSDSDGSGSDEEYKGLTKPHVRKRRKTSRQKPQAEPTRFSRRQSKKMSSTSGLEALPMLAINSGAGGDKAFDDTMEPLLPELLDAAAVAQVERIKYDEMGQAVIPMSRIQSHLIANQLVERASESPALAMLHRRLRTHPDEWRRILLDLPAKPIPSQDTTVSPLEPSRGTPANPEVLDALYAIKTTPYVNSFLSRVQGYQPPPKPAALAVDWDNRTPWMDLMRDIRDHYSLMHPERDQPVEVEAAIEYTTLRPSHLDQIHDLLARAFWAGIDISDSLHYSPERCTVIATYKRLVVGATLLSSPIETYINYLVVRPGWDNSQIATSMLYHLITLNPRRDITLHVSINNPAVLLYNRFGFKAEEFIVGFYEDYLDTQSRASKNAFRLRLRR